MNANALFCTGIVALAFAAGCAAPADSSRSNARSSNPSTASRPDWEDPQSSTATDTAVTSSTPMSSVVLPVDDGSSDGVAILRWQISDKPSVISTFFSKHTSNGLSIDVQKRLANNGVVVAQIQLADLPQALEELGGTYSSVRSWLGQATTWNQLSSYRVRGTVAAVVDGSTNRFKDGSLQLLLRGWTVALEDGAVTDIEILTSFLPGGEVPGARSTLRQAFPSAGFFLSLERGSTLLITAVAPKTTRDSSTHAPLPGPPVTAPPTLGELLMTRPTDSADPLPLRTCIVIIPLISSRYFFADRDATVDSAAPTQPR